MRHAFDWYFVWGDNSNREESTDGLCGISGMLGAHYRRCAVGETLLTGYNPLFTMVGPFDASEYGCSRAPLLTGSGIGESYLGVPRA